MALKRVLAEKKKCDKDNIDYNTIEGLFFDSENYKLLTKIVTPPVDKDTDYVMESESNSDSELDPVELKNKRKRGRSESDPSEPKNKIIRGPGGRPSELKPLCEFSPPAIKEKTDKGYELLLKEWSDVNSKTPIPFDKYVAKLTMRYYFNTGENLDKQKGEMFKKVVTLLEF